MNKRKTSKFIPCLLLNMAWLAVPKTPTWEIPVLLLQFGLVGWMVRDFVTDGMSKAERQLATIRTRIAALEQELGIEPMNLHELDGIVRNN